jgi:RHS repeat-associated protein
MREGAGTGTTGLKWLQGDHLGSTSITANADGSFYGSLRYKPWGEVRYANGTTPTAFRFTGQRQEQSLGGAEGLYYYGARWYDPALGRFAQADSIIPEASQGTQAWDRYAGMNNNPVRYRDPSGHFSSEPEGCHTPACKPPSKPKLPKPPAEPPTNPTESEMIEYIESFGITLEGNWTGAMLANLWEALFTHIGYRDLALWLNGKTATLVWGGSRTCPEGMDGCYGGLTSYTTVTFSATNMVNPVINVLHELGHLVDNLWGDYFTNSLETQTFTLGGYLAGWDGEAYRSLPRGTVKDQALVSRNVGGGDAWQQRGGPANFEDWADIFSNGIMGNINMTDPLGSQMGNFFNEMVNHVVGGVR